MKLYLKYVTIHLKSQMQYKTSFALTIMGQFIVSFSAFLSIHFMFSRFHQVEGFTYSQVLLCFSIVLTAFAVAECFVRGFDTFPAIIGNGEFDRIMVRPRNEIFQVLASKIEFSRLGRLFQAVVVLIYALSIGDIQWSPAKILTLVLMIGSGILVFSGLFVIYAAICFFTLEGLEVMNIFTDGGREFGSYPFGIYGNRILRFFTYIIPLALVQYYPLLFLIGKEEGIFYMLSPLLTIIFLIPCYLIWKSGIRHYQSTGS